VQLVFCVSVACISSRAVYPKVMMDSDEILEARQLLPGSDRSCRVLSEPNL
jgi:hypothetical protein